VEPLTEIPAEKAAVRKNRRPAGSSAPYRFLLPSAGVLLAFMGIPLAVSIITSFNFYKLNVPGIYFNGIDNYIAVISDKFFSMTMINTFWWVLLSILFQSVLGLTLAMLLNQRYRGKRVYQALVLLPWAVPGFLTALIWKWMFNGQYGVINDILLRLKLVEQPIAFLARTDTSLLSVIAANVWYGIPFFAIMLYSALQTISPDIYEAAEIDGAGSVTRFFSITLAYIRPTIISTILMRIIWVFNSADMIYTMTGGGPRNSSATIATFILQKAFTDMNFGQASALGVIVLLMLTGYTLVYLFATKYDQAGDF